MLVHILLPLDTKLTHSGNAKVGIVKCVAQLASNTTSSFDVHVGFLLRALGLILGFFKSGKECVLRPKDSYTCFFPMVINAFILGFRIVGAHHLPG